MGLHGLNIISCQPSSNQNRTFRGFSTLLSAELDPAFQEATIEQVNSALESAEQAFHIYRSCSATERATLLERIAEEIAALGDELIERSHIETGLPKDRLTGERGRTINQLRMFAELIREGSWIDARIDRALPDRQPLPKPDIRRMLIPIGPVVVFSASNFPLAFSVAGGDTASALAAGCPVIVKAHRAHAGTSELVASAVVKAVEATGMPRGLFSLIHTTSHEIGMGLVKHPFTRAVGFTGSQQGGRALFDAAAQRPNPIPVYAEMGSINPVFILPGALRERADSIAEGLKNSVTLGVGQFCTKPGLTVGLRDDNLIKMIDRFRELITNAPTGPMLYPGILKAYEEGVKQISEIAGIEKAQSNHTADLKRAEARPTMFSVDARSFLQNHRLSEEIFGPATVIVSCGSIQEMEKIASELEGHLTATIHCSAEEIEEFRSLISILESKVGRLIINGFPTGVEVCASMHHGGPYPATADAHFTSVGTAAIHRFARPICYQNFPQNALPVELRNVNQLGIWRLVDNQLTKENC